MAREIHEREDLLRDARALVPRVKLRVTMGGREQEVFAGFRGEALSLYFGDDPVYHFNSRGELRRAFVDDRLIKAERGRIVVLERKPSPTESVLERQAQDSAPEQGLLTELSRRLDQLRAAIAAKEFKLIGEAPSSGEALPRLIAWLETRRHATIAASPRIT